MTEQRKRPFVARVIDWLWLGAALAWFVSESAEAGWWPRSAPVRREAARRTVGGWTGVVGPPRCGAQRAHTPEEARHVGSSVRYCSLVSGHDSGAHMFNLVQVTQRLVDTVDR